MKSLSEMQQIFCDGLRSPMQPPRELLDEIIDDGLQLERFNVYRNNFVVLNGDALADMYPVIKRLLGEDAFRLLATAYVREYPPMDRALLLYGEGFAEYLATVPELEELPYLADVARLEFAWTAAYHADDVVSLEQHQIAALSPLEVEKFRLRPHPSMHCISSDYPIYKIWLANQSGEMEQTISLNEGASQVIVIRPKMAVEVRSVTTGHLVFLQSLAAGETIGVAYTQALEADGEFDLNSFFAHHLLDGTFRELQV
ncbi:MAG: DNA-binding domain-containing protein [Candidatus Thiodiazotropha sp.]